MWQKWKVRFTDANHRKSDCTLVGASSENAAKRVAKLHAPAWAKVFHAEVWRPSIACSITRELLASGFFKQEGAMVTRKELESLIETARSRGAVVTVDRGTDGLPLWVTVRGLKGIGKERMPTLHAAERLREALAGN